MILVDAKTQSPISTPLKEVSGEEKPEFSFSQLLMGAKKGEKVVQNGALLLCLEDEQTVVSKNDSLLSLLKNETPLELNPKLTQVLTPAQLKTMVVDAKHYLKSKIMSSDKFEQLKLDELPKTLKGLVALGKKIGIDISKVSVEEITLSKKAPALADASKVKLTDRDALKSVTSDNKELKQTPLFKAQTVTEHTTQQVVALKQVKREPITKDKADESLKLLLRTDKSSLTADFSVNSAKVIAPASSTDMTRSLESLLHGDKTESTTQTLSSKTDVASAVHKADSFEVKLNEAKQMIKYISQDVKTAIEDYKSPFTRVKIQLNPQRLGEVDLTIIQRGKNLHVNLSSNSTAINTLAMNMNELRVQLQNSGINNATLNFNSNQDSTHSQQQQQNHQNGQKADEEYSYINDERDNEEILSSLEIVVPNYA